MNKNRGASSPVIVELAVILNCGGEAGQGKRGRMVTIIEHCNCSMSLCSLALSTDRQPAEHANFSGNMQPIHLLNAQARPADQRTPLPAADLNCNAESTVVLLPARLPVSLIEATTFDRRLSCLCSLGMDMSCPGVRTSVYAHYLRMNKVAKLVIIPYRGATYRLDWQITAGQRLYRLCCFGHDTTRNVRIPRSIMESV